MLSAEREAGLRARAQREAGRTLGQANGLSSTAMTVSRLRPYATTVFAEMSALAARVGAVNLGQGFPDEDGPPAMLKAAQDAIADGVNQYPPGIGIAALREAVAAQRKRKYGIDYDPDDRGAGHRRGHRGHRGGGVRSGRARLRGDL